MIKTITAVSTNYVIKAQSLHQRIISFQTLITIALNLIYIFFPFSDLYLKEITRHITFDVYITVRDG